MTRYWFAAIAVFSLSGTVFGQESDVAAGRRLVASLQLQQAADAVTFREVGSDRAGALLMAVYNQGSSPSATPADWTNLHRALTGLVELYSEQGDFLRAAIYAQLQDSNYRNLEHDYRAALTAATLSVELLLRSGATDNLDRSWDAVGRDQMSLAQPGPALESFRKAQVAEKAPMGEGAGFIWRDLVDARLALQDVTGARSEALLFLNAAQGAPQEYRRQALLADCDVLIEEKRYEAVLDRLKEARASGASDTDIFLQLLSADLLAMRSLDYKDSIALAERMETEFTGLPYPVAALARQAADVRRRMAGDMDGILREQTAALAAFMNSGNVRGQIQALESIAASYSAANSIRNQAASLEQARNLVRSLFTSDGRPGNVADASAFFRISNNLGDAELRLREIGRARQAFVEVTRLIDALPEATARTDAAPDYGYALLGKAAAAAMDDDAD